MASFTLAKRRVLVCVLVLLLVAGAITISGWKDPQILEQVRKYADDVGFAEFLDLPQPKGLKKTGTTAEERVADYLGDAEVLDEYEERPLVGETDPDMAEIMRENSGDDIKYTTAVSVAEYSATTKSSPQLASTASTTSTTSTTKKGGGRKSGYKQGTNAGAFVVDNTKAGARLGSAKNLAAVPEPAYPKIPPQTQENTRVPLAFRVYSHNVKTAHEGRKLMPGEVPWEARKRLVAGAIKLHASANTIVVLQEPMKFQVDDILAELNVLAPPETPEWVCYGQGRMDGAKMGEHVPICVRQAEWAVVYNDTFWLNEHDPRRAIVGWDAKHLRIVTYATLKHHVLGQYVNVANTHFDHEGGVARTESARLVALKMAALNEWPVIVAGDLNAPPKDDSLAPWSPHFVDVHALVPAYARYGHPDYSYTGFAGEYLRDAKRIDYVLAPSYIQKPSASVCAGLTRVASLQATGYGLLHSKYGGVYMSDHRPVMADFLIQSC